MNTVRDPQRIPEFCGELADVWAKNCPDWRFGQLIVNVFGDSDPFFLEEEAAMERLRDYFERKGTTAR